MTPRLVIELHNPAQAWAAIKAQLFPFLRAAFAQGGRWVLKVEKRKRTAPQNRRYWGRGVLAQVAEQAVVGGRLFPAEVWHELMKRKFIGVVDLPDGSVTSKSSTELTTEEFSEFCSQVEAYAATELGVVFYDLEGP
jgi:hypothetical protein